MMIEVKGLAKRFGDRAAVDGIDFSVGEGEVFGLLGPNGAGKTTALHMLATLLRPTAGTALVNGFDVVRQPSRVRASIGMVFQEPSSDDLLTGYENLRLRALMHGVPAAVREERIREALALVDLAARQDDLVKKYSGGMRRRLELAAGLLHRPKILLLDEPTLGLDPQTREHIWEYIEKLAAERKVTVVLTTHYMEEADRLCSRIAIIDRGKLAVLDAPARLKKALGGDIVRLRARNPRLAEIENLDYVKKVERKGETVTLTVVDASRHLQEILNRIGEVESVEVRPPTLEDVFLHYTGREFREQAPAEGGFWERATAYQAKR